MQIGNWPYACQLVRCLFVDFDPRWDTQLVNQTARVLTRSSFGEPSQTQETKKRQSDCQIGKPPGKIGQQVPHFNPNFGIRDMEAGCLLELFAHFPEVGDKVKLQPGEVPWMVTGVRGSRLSKNVTRNLVFFFFCACVFVFFYTGA